LAVPFVIAIGMRRTVFLLVVPMFLFAVQCEDGASHTQYTARQDDLLLDGVLGEWSYAVEGRAISLRLCEDRAPARTFCASRSGGSCSVNEACHDIKGGGRANDQAISNANGCDCGGNHAGAMVKGTLESEGEGHVLLGTLESDRVVAGGPYEPPFRVELTAPPGTHELRIDAVWDGSFLSVTGSLPPKRIVDLDGGPELRPPRHAFVEASVQEDRVLRTDAAKRFNKVASRTETCGVP
jgi:hypothetical protein